MFKIVKNILIGFWITFILLTLSGCTSGDWTEDVYLKNLFISNYLTFPSPFTLGTTPVTVTGNQLNYLNSASGTTGTTSTNLVYSNMPTIITPNITGINSVSADMRLNKDVNYDIDLWGGTYGTGRSFNIGTTSATASVTTKNSPTLALNARYWSGVSSTSWDAKMVHTMVATTPASSWSFSINTVPIMSLKNTAGTVSFFLYNVPTSDPHVAGQVWRSSGTLKLSSG